MTRASFAARLRDAPARRPAPAPHYSRLPSATLPPPSPLPLEPLPTPESTAAARMVRWRMIRFTVADSDCSEGPPPSFLVRTWALPIESSSQQGRVAGSKRLQGGRMVPQEESETARDGVELGSDELVRCFSRSESIPNIERIFAHWDGSVLVSANQTMDGAAPTQLAPQPNTI